MCRFIETIKIKDGRIENMLYHNERLNRTRKDVFKCSNNIDLNDHLKIPRELTGPVKCRVIYSREIENISYEIYRKRKISSLKIVIDESIDYGYKYLDRGCFDDLLLKKGACDEIIIVKNGKLTDTSFSNIVLSDGKKLLTPSRPLLKGVKRRKLLDESRILEEEITAGDLRYFNKIILINAMLDLEDDMSVPIHRIEM